MKLKISNYRIIVYVLFVYILIGCTYKHDGKLVKDTEGNIYKLVGSQKIGEAYYLVEIDTVDYSSKFK